jgi:hypothetical protein
VLTNLMEGGQSWFDAEAGGPTRGVGVGTLIWWSVRLSAPAIRWRPGALGVTGGAQPTDILSSHTRIVSPKAIFLALFLSPDCERVLPCWIASLYHYCSSLRPVHSECLNRPR